MRRPRPAAVPMSAEKRRSRAAGTRRAARETIVGVVAVVGLTVGLAACSSGGDGSDREPAESSPREISPSNAGGPAGEAEVKDEIADDAAGGGVTDASDSAADQPASPDTDAESALSEPVQEVADAAGMLTAEAIARAANALAALEGGMTGLDQVLTAVAETLPVGGDWGFSADGGSCVRLQFDDGMGSRFEIGIETATGVAVVDTAGC